MSQGFTSGAKSLHRVAHSGVQLNDSGVLSAPQVDAGELGCASIMVVIKIKWLKPQR